jgi:hypothetical protein
MTTLTFDYFDSPKRVDHEATLYKTYAGGWLITPYAWNGQAFDVQPITVHNSDGTTSQPDVTLDHLENTFLPTLAPEVIKHSPGPGYLDLWAPIGVPLYMRVAADVPVPQNWSDVVSTDYSAGASPTWDQDAATWVNDILVTWYGQLLRLTSSPVSEVSLRDYATDLTVATISATSPIEPKEFMNFAAYETVVYGSKFNDIVGGGNVGDELFGEAGNDVLYAGTGPATLNGGEGNDRLYAGPGGDELTGGPGADKFIFILDNDSPDGPLHDVITDFHPAQHDKIALPFARGFAFIGHHTFPWGQAHYSQAHGLIRIAQGNLVEARFDGDHAPTFELKVHVHGSALDRSDFIFHA